MADVQIVAGGTSAAPLAYKVPGAQEIILKALFATFDGTGAGGAFLPCVRVIAPGGKVVGEYVTDSSVAAGSSAEVSFAPFLRGATSSTPVTSTGLPWCFMQRSSVVVPNFVATTTPVDFDLANAQVSGFSSDPTIFTAGAAIGGGLHGISILVEGQYLWTATAFATKAAPPAGSTSAIRTSWDTGDLWVGQYVSPFVTGPGAAVAQTQPSLVEQLNVIAGGSSPPQDSTLFLTQNTGANLTFTQPTLAVFQLSPVGTLDFT